MRIRKDLQSSSFNESDPIVVPQSSRLMKTYKTSLLDKRTGKAKITDEYEEPNTGEKR